MELITTAFIRIHMVRRIFNTSIDYNLIFQNNNSAKLIAENICKTTTCKEHYPQIHNEDYRYDFLTLSEKHVKVSIVLQQEISHNFEVLFNLYKVTGSNRNDLIGEVSLEIDVASNNCEFSLTVFPTPPGHSNKEVSKEIPLGKIIQFRLLRQYNFKPSLIKYVFEIQVQS